MERSQSGAAPRSSASGAPSTRRVVRGVSAGRGFDRNRGYSLEPKRTSRGGSAGVGAPAGARSSSAYSPSSSRGSFVGGPSRGPVRSSTGGAGSRSYTGGSSFSGSRSFTGGNGGGRFKSFSGNRGGGRGRGRSGSHVDVSKYVNRVTVTEEVEIFIPEHKFVDFHVTEELKAAIVQKGYELPTPIQDKAIPHVINGQDLVGIANTGTGKTAAFLIPMLNKALQDLKSTSIIIVPTRELAIQIQDELIGFTNNLMVTDEDGTIRAPKSAERIYSVCCVGGAPIGKQIKDLYFHNQFIIGTPGRLKDLIDRKMISLKQISTIVLDEADRMLDMGFINDMKAVMAGMPKDRQTLFFSATLSFEIEKLIHEFLNEPVRISVKTQDTSKNVDQDVVRMTPGQNKIDVLSDMLKKDEFSKVLIFGKTKHGVEKLSHTLNERGFKTESIHGDKNHRDRQRALGAFKDNSSRILVATDVAARGLDIADISHVINYELPETYEDYTHRIGRTGRAGKKGKALTFIG